MKRPIEINGLKLGLVVLVIIVVSSVIFICCNRESDLQGQGDGRHVECVKQLHETTLV